MSAPSRTPYLPELRLLEQRKYAALQVGRQNEAHALQQIIEAAMPMDVQLQTAVANNEHAAAAALKEKILQFLRECGAPLQQQQHGQQHQPPPPAAPSYRPAPHVGVGMQAPGPRYTSMPSNQALHTGPFAGPGAQPMVGQAFSHNTTTSTLPHAAPGGGGVSIPPLGGGGFGGINPVSNASGSGSMLFENNSPLFPLCSSEQSGLGSPFAAGRPMLGLSGPWGSDTSVTAQQNDSLSMLLDGRSGAPAALGEGESRLAKLLDGDAESDAAIGGPEPPAHFMRPKKAQEAAPAALQPQPGGSARAAEPETTAVGRTPTPKDVPRVPSAPASISDDVLPVHVPQPVGTIAPQPPYLSSAVSSTSGLGSRQASVHSLTTPRKTPNSPHTPQISANPPANPPPLPPTFPKNEREVEALLSTTPRLFQHVRILAKADMATVKEQMSFWTNIPQRNDLDYAVYFVLRKSKKGDLLCHKHNGPAHAKGNKGVGHGPCDTADCKKGHICLRCGQKDHGWFDTKRCPHSIQMSSELVQLGLGEEHIWSLVQSCNVSAPAAAILKTPTKATPVKPPASPTTPHATATEKPAKPVRRFPTSSGQVKAFLEGCSLLHDHVVLLAESDESKVDQQLEFWRKSNVPQKDDRVFAVYFIKWKNTPRKGIACLLQNGPSPIHENKGYGKCDRVNCNRQHYCVCCGEGDHGWYDVSKCATYKAIQAEAAKLGMDEDKIQELAEIYAKH